MADGLTTWIDEKMIGNRVNTFKYGFGVMSGKCESIGEEYRRYEVILDDPSRWPCSSLADTGPFFDLKELQFA